MKQRVDLGTIKQVFSGFLKRQLGDRKRLFIFIVVAVLLLINLILDVSMKKTIGDLPQYLLADRWSEDERMAQISIYATEDQQIDEDNIKRFEYQLEKKLIESGVTDPDADEKESGKKVIDTIGIDEMNKEPLEEEITYREREGVRKLFAVGYCAQGQVTLSFENRTAENAAAIGVGGDFFLFHPMTFVTGGPFSGEDLMKDYLVIDEDLAWQLFGSSDIIGECVDISGIPHYIVGVVKKETGKIAKASGLNKSYVYMSYDSLSRYGKILSGRTATRDISEDGATAQIGGINCIEVICPNPVNGLAAKVCRESLGINAEFVSVIDDTDRFSFFSLIAVLRSFGTRSMWSKAIFYPYWENMARGYEDILASMLFIRIICILISVILFVISIVNAYRKKTWTVRSVVRYLSDKKYDLEAEHKLRKQRN
jgi:hypothetical protein